MKTKAMVVVPYWVENVLKRNRLNFTDLLQYGKMRDVMSVNELSAFLTVQHTGRIPVINNIVNTYLLSSWEQTRSSDEKTELDSVVVPLSYSEETVSDVVERLSQVQEDTEQKPYEIVDFAREAFVVVLRKGFMQDMLNPTKQLDFVRDLLKLYYCYYEPHEVSSLQIFQNYLDRLNTGA